jgi:hypothetical protein
MGKRLLSSRKSRDVTVPDIGTVTVKQLNATDLVEFLQWVTDTAKKNPDASMLTCLSRAMAYSCFDAATGERIFTLEDAEQLADIDAGVFAELSAVVREFNPTIFSVKTEDPRGNGASSPPSGDSPTGSQENSDVQTST